MNIRDVKERDELVDLVAQAVVDRLEERSKIGMLVEMVVQRIYAIQAEDAKALNLVQEDKGGKGETEG